MQGENSDYPDSGKAAGASAVLCKEKRHSFRRDLHNQERKAVESEQYLGADENALRTGAGESQ